MCVAIPGRVIAIEKHQAEIDVLGSRRRANAMLVPEVQVGDYVLTSAGMIVQILDEDEAIATATLFQEIMALNSAGDDIP